LVSVEQWENQTTIIRIEHIYQAGEDASLSQSATVDLSVWHDEIYLA
jgi:hypothetical protein